MADTRLEQLAGQGGYAFGPFVVDPLRRRLWRDGRPVPITSKTFDVLVVLLEHRGHVVSKDELLNRVWPNTAVNENNLARQISSLRRALGQRPDQHDYVVTIPGQGYRFVASVQDVPDEAVGVADGRRRPCRTLLSEPARDLESLLANEHAVSDQSSSRSRTDRPTFRGAGHTEAAAFHRDTRGGDLRGPCQARWSSCGCVLRPAPRRTSTNTPAHHL